MIPVLLLPIAFLSLALLLLGEADPSEDDWGAVGGALVRAAVLTGTFIAVSTEVLASFRAISTPGVALAWSLWIIGVAAVGRGRGSLRRGLERGKRLSLSAEPGEWALLVGLALVCGALLVVALASPPNNIDSLQYHMSRVMHWAQQRSLEPYATAYSWQLANPIWAETAILHLRMLWGDDRLANLVQWLSMVGCVVGTLSLGSSLGLGFKGSLLAATFVVSIPMGILQSTSTQNDYVVAFWILCTAYLIVRSRDRSNRLDQVCLALAVGLGLLTKSTFLVLVPLLLWYGVLRWKQIGLVRLVVEGSVMVTLVVVINLGFWARNLSTFGSLYGDRYLWVARVLGNGDAQGTGTARGPGMVAQYVIRTLKTTAYDLQTPVGRLNQATLSMLRTLPGIFDERFVAQWTWAAWNHEDTAGSPMHLFAAAFAAGLVLSPKAPQRERSFRPLAVVLVASYFLLPVMIEDDRVYVVRYHLSFFVLAGPIVAVAAARLERRRLFRWLPWLFLVASLPWVILNNMRPLVGWKPWPTRVGSVLTTDPAELLFAADPKRLEPYRAGTDLVQGSECTRVGLRLDSGDLEYVFWWLLRAPQSGIRIESIYAVDRLQRYVDPTFQPCAILCTICGDRQRLHGLPLVADLPGLSVFLGPGYVADPDG